MKMREMIGEEVVVVTVAEVEEEVEVVRREDERGRKMIELGMEWSQIAGNGLMKLSLHARFVICGSREQHHP
jgi:hypothetical protein